MQHTVTVTSISKNDVSKAKADRASYAREMEAAKAAPGFVIEGAVGDRADDMNGSYACTTESKNGQLVYVNVSDPTKCVWSDFPILFCASYRSGCV